MKVKTSVTLSEEVLQEVDSVVEKTGNRSALIEEAVREYLQRLRQRARDERDLYILNEQADELNEEALDVLSYQVEL
ncbi:MAG: ribbon-helix-helix domain-containing protein [Thermoanaerobaculia bacterium]